MPTAGGRRATAVLSHGLSGTAAAVAGAAAVAARLRAQPGTGQQKLPCSFSLTPSLSFSLPISLSSLPLSLSQTHRRRLDPPPAGLVRRRPAWGRGSSRLLLPLPIVLGGFGSNPNPTPLLGRIVTQTQ